VIPFRVEFRPGISLCEQVVYAAKKAVISGQLRPGDAFPSVRALSTALKINPNTAHKVITHLLNEGLLEVNPGLGTVVAQPPEASAAQRSRLLNRELEKLVLQAKGLGLDLDQVQGSLAAHWERLDPGQDTPGPAGKSGRSRK
jgi:GntR family transcriptional regulator